MSKQQNRNHRKTVLVALGAGLAVASIALASAAGLGGLTIANIGAETAVVASPLSDGISVTWGEPVYDAVSGTYVVSDFTVSQTDEDKLPAGELSVTVADADGASLSESTATTDGDSSTAVFTLTTPIPAKDIENVAIVLHG